MRYRKVSEALGAELLDFDITRPCSLEDQAELRALFSEHHLLLVRGQNPTEADQDRFTAYFGPLSLMYGRKPEGEVAGHVTNKADALQPDQLKVTGEKMLPWHVDGAYGIHPGIGTSLLAIDIAPDSVPTMFASATRALKKLPPELRGRIEGLKTMHYQPTYQDSSKQTPVHNFPVGTPRNDARSFAHPIVYQLPHIDKKVVFVNESSASLIPNSMSHVLNVPPEEGKALIQELFSYLYADDNIYTHRWQVGDVVIWDNIALQHCRPADFENGAPRHLRRLSLDGWNTGHGVMEWFAGGSVRDTAAA